MCQSKLLSKKKLPIDMRPSYDKLSHVFEMVDYISIFKCHWWKTTTAATIIMRPERNTNVFVNKKRDSCQEKKKIAGKPLLLIPLFFDKHRAKKVFLVVFVGP